MFLGVFPVVGSHDFGTSPGDKRSNNKFTQEKKRSIFETYMSKEAVSECLKRGVHIQVLKNIGKLFPECGKLKQSLDLSTLSCVCCMFEMII